MASSSARPARVEVLLLGNAIAEEPMLTAGFGDYQLDLRLREKGDELVLTHLAVTVTPGADAEVTSSALRSIEVHKLVNAARSAVRHNAEIFLKVMGGATPTERRTQALGLARRRIRAAMRQPGPVGRTGYGDDFYRSVAVAYLAEVDAGRTRRIYSALRDSLSAPGFDAGVRDEETIRTWVRLARQKGFLSPGESGRAGARPGPRLTEGEPT